MSATPQDVNWDEPEPVTRRRKNNTWEERLTPLKAHPKRWANLGVFSASYAAQLAKRSSMYQLPPGEWEFTCRRRDLPLGQAHLFARFMGEDEMTAEES